MERFNVIIRRSMVETFQEMLRAVRILMQLNKDDIGEYIGVSAEEIEDFESGEEQMPVPIFLALSAFVEDFLSKNPGLRSAFDKLLTPKFDNSDIQNYFDSITEQLPAYFPIRIWLLTFSRQEESLVKAPEEPLTDQDLARLISSYKFFADDSVIMHPAFPIIMSRLAPIFKALSVALFVPVQVMDIVREQFEGDDRDEIEATISRYCTEQVIKFLDEEQGEDIKNVLESIFRERKGTNRLALITQDAYFASDILDLNYDATWQTSILAVYVNEENDLVLYDEQSMTDDEQYELDTENLVDFPEVKGGDTHAGRYNEEIRGLGMQVSD